MGFLDNFVASEVIQSSPARCTMHPRWEDRVDILPVHSPGHTLQDHVFLWKNFMVDGGKIDDKLVNRWIFTCSYFAIIGSHV